MRLHIVRHSLILMLLLFPPLLWRKLFVGCVMDYWLEQVVQLELKLIANLRIRGCCVQQLQKSWLGYASRHLRGQETRQVVLRQ